MLYNIIHAVGALKHSIAEFLIKIFGRGKTIMEINASSPDFFSCLIEKYRNKIIIPYKNGEELLGTLKALYCFEPIDYKEAMVEMRGFVVGKNITKERSIVYLLKLNDSSKIFYKYHAARFFLKSRIILLIDKDNDEFISNDHLFQTKINILRGINKENVENFTQEFKIYLNLFYLYDSALEKDNIFD